MNSLKLKLHVAQSLVATVSLGMEGEKKILSLIVKVCSTFMLSVFDLPTVYQESLVVAITQTQKLSSSTLQHFNSCRLQPFYRVDTTEGIDSLSRVAKPQRKITRWLARPNL